MNAFKRVPATIATVDDHPLVREDRNQTTIWSTRFARCSLANAISALGWRNDWSAYRSMVTYRSTINIKRKLGLHNAVELTRAAVQWVLRSE